MVDMPENPNKPNPIYLIYMYKKICHLITHKCYIPYNTITSKLSNHFILLNELLGVSPSLLGPDDQLNIIYPARTPIGIPENGEDLFNFSLLYTEIRKKQ